MKVTGFNHLSIGTKNLAESVKFYETVLGMQTIPSYNFGFKTKYLRCGDLQLHIFELEDQVPFYQHFAVDVDDFHAAYDAAKAMRALDSTALNDAVATQGHDHPARKVLASASRPLPAPGVRQTRVGRRS